MKRSWIAWFVVGVTPALLAGAWWFGMENAPKHRISRETDGSTQPQDYAELREQVQTLSRLTRQLQASVKQQPATATPVDRAGEDSTERDNPDPLLQLKPLEREELLMTTTLELMESTFESEASDPDYSAEASQAIEERLSQETYAGTRAIEVNCGASLCRFRFGHETQDAREPFQGLIGTGAMRGNTFFNFDPETLETVVYVAREGHDLPKADLRAAAARL